MNSEAAEDKQASAAALGGHCGRLKFATASLPVPMLYWRAECQSALQHRMSTEHEAQQVLILSCKQLRYFKTACCKSHDQTHSALDPCHQETANQ